MVNMKITQGQLEKPFKDEMNFHSKRLKTQEKEELHAVDGQYCPLCNSILDVDFDEGYDEDGFQAIPYLYCDNCKRRVRA